MTENRVNAQIFDERLRTLRRARAQKRMSKHGLSFLFKRCLDDVAERLLDINRQFENAVLVGPFDLRKEINARLPPNRRIKHIEYVRHVKDISWPEPQHDLIISLLDLQSENNLPDYIVSLAQALKADGLFIASMFGGRTLTELRQSFYQTDEAMFEGLSAHIFPMITHSLAAQLLARAKLNLPVIDVDRFTVSYSGLSRLIDDLRDMGETNVLLKRTGQPLGRRYLENLEENYRQTFSKKAKLPAHFEILWLTAWSPHNSQQKPLKPGTAKMRIADALSPKPSKS